MALNEMPNLKLEAVKVAQPRRDYTKIENLRLPGVWRQQMRSYTLVASQILSGSRSSLLSYSADTWNHPGPHSTQWPEQWDTPQGQALQNLPWDPGESRRPQL